MIVLIVLFSALFTSSITIFNILNDIHKKTYDFNVWIIFLFLAISSGWWVWFYYLSH